jgi:sec-independent protein translocase protein TatA
MFDVGATELLVVAVLAVMLYGGDLPDVARKAGSTVKRLRGVADDLKRQVTMPPEMQAEVREVKAELKKVPEAMDLRNELAAPPRKPGGSGAEQLAERKGDAVPPSQLPTDPEAELPPAAAPEDSA